MFGNKINLLFITVLVISISFSESGVFKSPPSTNTAYPNKCYDEKLKRAFAVGESYKPEDQCAKITCQPDFSFYGETCTSFDELPKGCAPIQRIRMSDTGYPNCCEKWYCLNRNGTTTYIE